MASKRAPYKLPVHADPKPELPIERGPKGKGVGPWVPNVKHTLLAKYIGAASGAMKGWPNRVFIDPFCGPGRVQVQEESFTRDGGALVAWRQSVACGAPYSHMFVGDLVPERAAACRERLEALGAPVRSFVGRAEDTVRDMVDSVPSGALCLAYVDPYNLALLKYEMISTLSKLRNVDFAVNFCTMDLLRNVDHELDPERARFDEVSPGWRERLEGSSRSNLLVSFFNDWITQVKSLEFKFSEAMPLVTNRTNHEIYKLAFFARHPLPNTLWTDIAKNPNMPLFPED